MRGGRQAILKAAIEVFARKGYAGASTREICREAGVTKPVLYYHFRGKEQLYRELMIDAFGNYRKLLQSAAQTRGGLRERLVRMVQTDFRWTRCDPLRMMFVLRMVFSPGDQLPFFDVVAEMEKDRDVIANVLLEGQDARGLRKSARELATALIGMQLIATLEYLFTRRPTLTRRRAERCVDLLLQGGVARQKSCRSV